MNSVYSTHKCGDGTRDVPFYNVSEDEKEELFGYKRSTLWDSTKHINNRDWNKLQKQQQLGSLKDLELLKKDFMNKCRTNNPWPKDLQEQHSRRKGIKRPFIICEFGFGFTTYTFLEWCIKNDGYLITVELPIAKPSDIQKENFSEIYYHGVDKYARKYPHCIALANHPVSKKRWLWINDDIFDVIGKIKNDKEYRSKLFYDEKVDYFYEDAIHDDTFISKTKEILRSFMPKGSIFTGDDNAKGFHEVM